MYRSGLLLGALTLLTMAGTTLVSPFCTPCIGLFLGLGAGYLAGVFERPATSSAASKAGAIGGAIAGLGALLGLGLGSAINGFLVGPEKAMELVRTMGLPAMSTGEYAPMYWTFLVAESITCGALNVVLMGAFGALGAYLWWRVRGAEPQAAISGQ